jgi:hypothetical protein
MASVGLVWRTVRHLKLQQIVGRVRFCLYRPAIDTRGAPPARSPVGPWVAPAMREPSVVGETRLRFFGEEHDLRSIGWDDPRIDKLWRYNQHYFDDLNARDSRSRRPLQRALVSQWVLANPPGHGTGWEPYPVSLRIVNWIKWFLQGEPPPSGWLDSLATQTRWLARRLEKHLLGNHLFANAKALVYAGLFFSGTEANRWLHTGVTILRHELHEQILKDGGQFERSPMYHALALEDVLDLINVIRAFSSPAPGLDVLKSDLCAHAERMLYWLRCMSHPDGSLGLFNDCAGGVAPDNHEIECYAARLGVRAPLPPPEGVTPLAASGYVRLARGHAVALIDVAPVGPDYLPAHAHADTLSFELSVGGQRVIVNGGTSCYGRNSERQRERGTGAHNTVQIAGADSSEVWAGFRVGRRARPGELAINDWEVCGSHDGYRFLPDRPEHRRCWQLSPGAFTVRDSVSSTRSPAVARYILAPDLHLRALPSGEWRVARSDTILAGVQVVQGQAKCVTGIHAPRFGVRLPVECLAVTLLNGVACTRWTWSER